MRTIPEVTLAKDGRRRLAAPSWPGPAAAPGRILTRGLGVEASAREDGITAALGPPEGDRRWEATTRPSTWASSGTSPRATPELGKKFFDWYYAVFAEGALSEREKALIALAVAHTVQCPYCIDAYTKECLAEGLRSRADDRGACTWRPPSAAAPRWSTACR